VKLYGIVIDKKRGMNKKSHFSVTEAHKEEQPIDFSELIPLHYRGFYVILTK